MTEENHVTGEADELPPGSQKTKEQWIDEGNLLFELKRYEEALLTYEQALHLDPTSAEASNGKAISLVFLNREEEALAAYEQVIRLDDDPFYSYLAYVNSATILATHSRYEEALVASEGAIRLENPSYAPNHVGKGWLLVKLDRYEEALTAYQEASDLAPNDAGIWHTIGDLLTALERAQEAEQAYEKARQLDSGGEA